MDDKTRRIAELVEQRTGISIDSIGESHFKKILNELLQALDINREEYLARLNLNQDDFQDLVEKLVVPETWFFRDNSSYKFISYYLTNVLIPSLVVPRPIRILSVPCSSGEEPYSIAIQLLQAKLTSKDFSIDAFDISQVTIEKAKKGVYTSYSFRDDEMESSKLHHYFDVHHNQFKIKTLVTDCVSFRQENILRISQSIKQKYDIIFCKNLLIYMAQNARVKLLNNLDSLLKNKGILIVSPVETEYVRKFGYTQYPYPESYAFQKKGVVPQKKIQQIVKKNAIQQTNEVKTTEVEGNLLEQAKKLADQGHFKEAIDRCHAYLTQHGPDSKAYFILGLIAHADKKELEAENYFLKTIYIEPDNYEALIYLALLAEKKGEKTQAELFFNRASRVKSQQSKVLHNE